MKYYFISCLLFSIMYSCNSDNTVKSESSAQTPVTGIKQEPPTQKEMPDLPGNDKEPEMVYVSDFYISKAEINQGQWQAVMGDKGMSCNDCPITDLSLDEIHEYLRKLYQITHKSYRLPYRHEWEMVANLQSHEGKFPVSAGEAANKLTDGKPNHIVVNDMDGSKNEWTNSWINETEHANELKKQMEEAARIEGRGYPTEPHFKHGPVTMPKPGFFDVQFGNQPDGFNPKQHFDRLYFHIVLISQK